MATKFKAAQHNNNRDAAQIKYHGYERSSRRRAYPKKHECRPRFPAVAACGDGAAVRYLVRGNASRAHRLRFATRRQYNSTKKASVSSRYYIASALGGGGGGKSEQRWGPKKEGGSALLGRVAHIPPDTLYASCNISHLGVDHLYTLRANTSYHRHIIDAQLMI